MCGEGVGGGGGGGGRWKEGGREGERVGEGKVGGREEGVGEGRRRRVREEQGRGGEMVQEKVSGICLIIAQIV